MNQIFGFLDLFIYSFSLLVDYIQATYLISYTSYYIYIHPINYNGNYNYANVDNFIF